MGFYSLDLGFTNSGWVGCFTLQVLVIECKEGVSV